VIRKRMCATHDNERQSWSTKQTFWLFTERPSFSIAPPGVNIIDLRLHMHNDDPQGDTRSRGPAPNEARGEGYLVVIRDGV
jgi:hypothetical protein